MWPFSTNQKAQVLAKRKSCLNYFYRIGFCGFIDRFLTQEANTWVTRYYLIKLTQWTKVSRSCTGQLLRSGTKHNRLLTGLVLPPVSWRNPTALGCCCSSLNDSVQILKASATELKVDFEKTLSAFQNFLRQFFFPAKISRLFFTGKRWRLSGFSSGTWASATSSSSSTQRTAGLGRTPTTSSTPFCKAVRWQSSSSVVFSSYLKLCFRSIASWIHGCRHFFLFSIFHSFFFSPRRSFGKMNRVLELYVRPSFCGKMPKRLLQ